MSTDIETPNVTREPVEKVVVRFAGDSGDGMQITGSQFTNTAAVLGNDLSTFPDFPAEIRAPAGSLPGVSGFQINFASTTVDTPGDEPDVLVAMNPAALKVNLGDLPLNGLLIVNSDNFAEKNLKLAGYESNPLEDGSLQGYRLVEVPLTTLTRRALEDVDLPRKQVDRCKNFFALGIMYYLYNRSTSSSEAWLERYFKNKPEVIEANRTALKAGHAYCEAARLFQTTYEVEKATFPPGKYRNINGNAALSLGLVAACVQAKTPMFLAGYPITPASDILHAMSRYKRFGVMTLQAEDEISAICAAIGAAYAGQIAVTTTSGPGMALKSEAIGLAVATELPLVIVDIQRGGPSTGLPTKTEQADLFQALYGRNSEAPLPVVSASSPGDCFWAAMEAVRIAVKYMTPVILLSDGYIANGAEPWIIPSLDELPEIPVDYASDAENFQPYQRHPETLARPWARPGTPGLEHRIGGLEKQDGTGNVNYDGENHDYMCRLRARRVANIATDIPDVEVDGPTSGKVLIVGWGGTRGAIRSALRRVRAHDPNASVAHVHLTHLNPFPPNLETLLKSFDHVLVPELNLGQLAFLLRAQFLVDAKSLTKVQGKPFKSSEIAEHLETLLKG